MTSEQTGAALGGLPRAVTLLLGVAAAVVTVAGARAFSGTLGPAFLALVLVVSVHPAQVWLRRHRVPGWLGVLTVLLLVYAVLLALLAALAYSVAQLVTLLPSYSTQFTHLLDQGTGLLRRLGIGQDQIQSALDQVSLSNVVGPLRQVLGSATTLLSDLVFVVTLVFFFGLDAAGFSSRLTVLQRQRPQLVQALSSFASRTRSYVLVSTVFGLVVAVINVGELYWLAVPLPLLWGLLAFVTNYVPNVGFVLGLVPPALLALLQAGVGRMVAVVAAYAVVNLVIQSVLQPKIVGDSVGLSPTLTFLSLVFWSFAAGPLGALLAVPLSLFVKAVLVDADPALAWLRPLLGDDAEPQVGETEPAGDPAGSSAPLTDSSPGGPTPAAGRAASSSTPKGTGR